MSNNISDKVVVITGASSGLGESTARYLAARGAKVVLAARRAERLQQLAEEIRASGGEALPVVTDVTVKEQVQALIDATISRFGRVDVMINNSGLMAIAPMAQGRTDEWDRMIDINIKGVLYGIAAALPAMQQQNSGHIINVASVAGVKVFAPGGTVYSGTKYAVRAITEGLRMEVGGNIRATLISPGAVDSELKFGSNDEASSNNVKEFYKQAIPAESVARAIAYAIEQPAEVDINEVVLRPTVQEF
ncbi:SDR family oxidoreductase [Pseudomonas sp. NPDC089554]|uniref:SDR family oxidoreductase n=1 Tax=Pseudomonas sp. NPDC089554 TaxID=3390653 RepID=UPI003D04CB4C